ncbi:MAG: hypothetical protein R2883_01005 [Caldisericia bacterium]
MKKLLLAIFLTLALVVPSGMQDVQCTEIQTGKLFVTPNRFFCPNKSEVTFTILYKNNTDTDLEKGYATFKVCKDLEIVSTEPSLSILGDVVSFTTPELTPGTSYSVKIKLRVNTTETKLGFAMLSECTITHGNGGKATAKKQGVVLLWTPSKYPLIEAQLKETAREKTRIEYDLIIEGGYPPYEYNIYWDEPGEQNSGGLLFEGKIELSHTFCKKGEYNIVCRITDSWQTKSHQERVYIIP